MDAQVCVSLSLFMSVCISNNGVSTVKQPLGEQYKTRQFGLFFLPVYLAFTAYRESSRTSSGRGAVEGVMVISDKSQTFLDVKLLL